MKINKHFKVLSLLLIPTICIPFILSSCSSATNTNTNNPSTNTIFETNGNVSVNGDLSAILPSEANTLNNQAHLLSYIFNNVINGKKNNIELKDISISSIVPNNTDGTLDVIYNIKNYWENDIKIVNEKEVKLKLSGLLKETTPTIFLNSITKDISSDSTLSSLKINQLSTNGILVQQWLFNNEISGNKDLLLPEDITWILTRSDIVNGTVSIQYDVNKYWTNKGLNNIPKNFSISLTGFQKIPLAGDAILQEINYGGSSNGLTVDKFFPIINHLNLSNRTRLNTLSNGELNKIISTIANSDLNGLQLAIESGNQSNNQLVLSIIGTYKNATIPLNTHITISGFHNSIDNYESGFIQFQSSIYISEINFNLHNFFNDMQTDENIKTWTSSQWTDKYLSSLMFRKIPSTDVTIIFDFIKYYNQKIFDNVLFNNVENSIVNSSWSGLNIKANYSNYQYNKTTQSWEVINDSTTTFTFTPAPKGELAFTTPTANDAIDWMASNKTTFNTTETSQYFASYWYSLYRNTNDSTSINSAITIDPTYKAKYFSRGNISMILDSMIINDLHGEMLITYKLIYEETLISRPTTIQTNTFKKLSAFINTRKEVSQNIIQVFNPSSPKGALASRIIRTVKNEFNIQALNTMQEDVPVEMRARPILFKGSSSYRLFNGESSSIDSKFDEAFLTYINPRLFNVSLTRSQSIDVDKNLFMPDGRKNSNTKFMINAIIINVDTSTAKSTLTKSGASQFTYKVPFTYYIDLGESNASIEINSYYFMTMSLTDIHPSLK